jgi:hypothetical protein
LTISIKFCAIGYASFACSWWVSKKANNCPFLSYSFSLLLIISHMALGADTGGMTFLTLSSSTGALAMAGN